MPILNRVAEFSEEMKQWRRTIHAYPETAFEEWATSDFVAQKLEAFGVRVHRGMAKTGVVGELHGVEKGAGAIALRADMDALNIQEQNAFDHRSQHNGKMHACGHDGHTAMLLGAAKYLAETRNFGGTVYFIFQPAEEHEGGGRVMVDEGLFERHPVSAVFGLHNWPGQPVGTIALRAGPMLAACDVFEIVVKGRGAHAAMPHQGIDSIVVAATLVTSLQTVVSRATNPQDAVVVSTTQIHAGNTWNVIPNEAVIRGTVRAFRPELQDRVEARMSAIIDGVCRAHDAEHVFRYERHYPPTINAPDATAAALGAAIDIVGSEGALRDPEPTMGSEDFGFMSRVKPGCYAWIGNGPGEGGCMLHNSRYDFNDDILPIGASYWARLVERELPRA